MSSQKILLTGATGFIGGSVLSELLQPETNILPKHSISVLIRGEEKVDVFKNLGVTPILFNSLDETDLLRTIASEHDIVIHTATGFHTGAAGALIMGLGDRKAAVGGMVHYLHTTGTSDIASLPSAGAFINQQTLSDTSDIYAYELSLEANKKYAQRTTDIVIVRTGLAVNVPTTMIMSPTIYGVGTGLFNKMSIQIPLLIREAIKAGRSECVGDGMAVWNHVHIADLVDLYAILLRRVLAGEEVPVGEEGILFSESGKFKWLDLAQDIGNALFALGAIQTKEVAHIRPEEAAKWLGGDALVTELSFASNARTVSDVGRQLGWKPVKTEVDFHNHILDEARLILGSGQLESKQGY